MATRSQHLLGPGGWSISGGLSGQSPFPVGGKDRCVSLLFFPLSHRSEIRSRQISPVEKKEAEAGPEKRVPRQSHTGREILPLKRKEKGIRGGPPCNCYYF